MSYSKEEEFSSFEDEYPADEGTGSLSSGGSPNSPRSESASFSGGLADLSSIKEGEVAATANHEENDDEVLDPAELEMLNEEAERMKGIGNRHMANQEFTRAYNAYSAALKLSPVGPSSHVFLSNRAAALLSLRQYSAAAVDARRAIALAPTFSKAHARLGQALYFMRDYSGAVAAYEDAVKYEPDNDVTRSYLEKARQKKAKKAARDARKVRGEDVSVDSSTQGGSISVATDPNASAAVVASGGGLRTSSNRISEVVGSEFKRSALAVSGGPLDAQQEQQEKDGDADDDSIDPDYDEALRLQEMATADLANKSYKSAVESYSAALFLVPDDALLSPQLHIGRAHALNGLTRHGPAINDARLAIRIDPTSSEAYSALAKSLFYEGEYEEAVEAFEKSSELLTPGESVSMFDQAYLLKAKECLEEEQEAEEATGVESPRRKKKRNAKAVPKLKPPRFVSREEVVESSLNLPPMPKTWPQQSVRQAPALKVGPERTVTFYSESLGVRLNRGASDGIVRVVSVKATTPGSPIARNGHIELGDVVREAAGVDLRRPVTSVMWSDTVALIKITPRPLELVLAKELSPPPPSFIDELAKASSASVGSDAKPMESTVIEVPPHVVSE